MSTMPGPTTPPQAPLLDADFMTRLERLELLSRKLVASRRKGERRSRRRGESVEFADFRNYASGDDVRHIDWNAYARLDRLFLKLFMEEEELSVCVLLDASTSMSFGAPSKSLYARRVAAAVAYIGLCNYDRVHLYAFTDGLRRRVAGLRHRRSMPRVVDFLENMTFEGPSGFSRAAKELAALHTYKGIGLVISDFLDKGGYEEGLRYLVGRGLDLYAVQVLSPEERAPDLAGDLRLVDCEDQEEAEITISKPLLDRYRARLQGHMDGLARFCTRRGIRHFVARSDEPFEALLLREFRRWGLVR